VKTIEEQAALPIVTQNEMGQPSLDAAVAQLAASVQYREALRRVFGCPLSGPGLDLYMWLPTMPLRCTRPSRDSPHS
jgi:cytochrome c peroxidase